VCLRWRRDVKDILTLVDDLVPLGSEIHIFADVPTSEREENSLPAAPTSYTRNPTIRTLTVNLQHPSISPPAGLDGS